MSQVRYVQEKHKDGTPLGDIYGVEWRDTVRVHDTTTDEQLKIKVDQAKDIWPKREFRIITKDE